MSASKYEDPGLSSDENDHPLLMEKRTDSQEEGSEKSNGHVTEPSQHKYGKAVNVTEAEKEALNVDELYDYDGLETDYDKYRRDQKNFEGILDRKSRTVKPKGQEAKIQKCQKPTRRPAIEFDSAGTLWCSYTNKHGVYFSGT